MGCACYVFNFEADWNVVNGSSKGQKGQRCDSSTQSHDRSKGHQEVHINSRVYADKTNHIHH